jgi:uncharacterized membrane protein SpoIIM required for sporulation
VFSLIFGAGAIFVLAWNASVIAAAVGIFSKNIGNLPLGIARYMIHGIPEITAYFVAAVYKCGMSDKEIENLIFAMISTGKRLNFLAIQIMRNQ